MLDAVATVQVLGTRGKWKQWGSYVHKDSLPDEVSGIIDDIGAYYEQRPGVDTIDWNVFMVWYTNTRHPKMDPARRSFVDMFLGKVKTSTNTPIVRELVHSWREAEYVSQVMDSCQQKHLGLLKKPLDATVHELTETFRTKTGTMDTKDVLVTLDEGTFATTACTTTGYEWRIEDLNRGIGPLRPGDFIVVGARPEVGKTSFAISEATHMLDKTPDSKILVINNEEMDWRIMLRFLTVILDMPSKDVLSNVPKALAMARGRNWTRDRIVIYPAHAAPMPAINQVIDDVKPTIIIVNRLDKIPTTVHKNSNDSSRFEQLGMWARTLASERPCIVMGIVQAGESAANHLVVQETELFGTKTALQAETDALILIGASNKHTNQRGIHVPRNKLLGGPRSVETLRHGFFEVGFNQQTGRYDSIAYRTKS